MKILSLDTASTICAVALVEDGREVASLSEELGKGHAERLACQISSLLTESGCSLRELDKLAVNVGPGSFTGIRVGVATVRALALALGKPAIGINQFAAFAYEAYLHAEKRPIAVLMPAYLDRYYLKVYDDLDTDDKRKLVDVIVRNHSEPLLIDCDRLVDHLPAQAILIGALPSGLAQDNPSSIVRAQPDAATFARMATFVDVTTRPQPLYLREPVVFGSDRKLS